MERLAEETGDLFYSKNSSKTSHLSFIENSE